ncbi:MAG TPA: prohibitin family protein [Noviherbaspirillum sp.]
MNDGTSRTTLGGALERLRRRIRYFSDDLLIGGFVVLALIAFMLPSMIVTIPAGHLGVLWKRFGGGTVVDHVVTEGTSLILPWDRIFVYDARLQSVDRDFEVLSSDGLKLRVNLAWRFRVVPENLAELHQYAGPNYAETLLSPSIGARARDVIAVYRPEDIYTGHRLEIQNQISESVRYDLKHRFNTDKRVDQDWVLIEDVLVKRIVLPDGVEESIVRKNMARHEVEQYALIVERELQETERKRVEALGIRNFQEIVSKGMSDSYLRWRGIEATLELARSNNAKVVVIGNNKTGGLPLIAISGEGGKSEDALPTRGDARAAGKAEEGAESAATAELKLKEMQTTAERTREAALLRRGDAPSGSGDMRQRDLAPPPEASARVLRPGAR